MFNVYFYIVFHLKHLHNICLSFEGRLTIRVSTMRLNNEYYGKAIGLLLIFIFRSRSSLMLEEGI